MGEIMGMTDSQYKDFVESVKEDLEELNEYKEAGDDAGTTGGTGGGSPGTGQKDRGGTGKTPQPV